MKIKYELTEKTVCLTKCPHGIKGEFFDSMVGSCGCQMCEYCKSDDTKNRIVDCSYGEKE